MDKTRFRSLKNAPRLWLAVFAAVTVVASVVSFTYEALRARSSVEQYVAIWEDDIAKAKIFQGDPALQNKILKQLREVHQAVILTADESSASLQCTFATEVPITLNSLPAGFLKVCFGPMELLGQALSSPLFLGSLLLGLVFLGFGWRRELLASLQEERLQNELHLSREIATVARQVAHDIRGPLTALTTLSRMSHEMSEEKKELLNLAVTRIRGVADDLLKKGQAERALQTPPSVVAEPDLSYLTESLLKEYRFSNPEITFTWHNHTQAPVRVPGLDPLKFQRILGNLLNNALEAAPETGAVINVTLMERSDQWLVQVMDNGCGIPEEVLPTLGAEGRSYGKEQGHGLGLFDARKTLQALGGDLQIRSREGVGTQVVLVLPKLNSSANIAR